MHFGTQKEVRIVIKSVKRTRDTNVKAGLGVEKPPLYPRLSYWILKYYIYLLFHC